MGDLLSQNDRRSSSGVIAGPALGLTGRAALDGSAAAQRRLPNSAALPPSSKVAALPPALLAGLQASYAMGRSSRAKAAAQPYATDMASNNAELATPQTAATRTRSPPAAVVFEGEEDLPPPPEPPLILPSTAAAVRTKERQLAGQGVQLARTGVGGAAPEEEEDEGESLSAAADAVLAEQQQGPGLLQRAVEAASSAAAGAYAAAAPVVKQAVAATADLAASGLGVAAGTAEAVAEAAAVEEGENAAPAKADTPLSEGTAPAAAIPSGPVRPRDAAATLAAAEHAAAVAPRAVPVQHKAAAAVTTAAVLPASAAKPAATGQGYFPTVGATAPAPVPEPTMSGGWWGTCGFGGSGLGWGAVHSAARVHGLTDAQSLCCMLGCISPFSSDFPPPQNPAHPAQQAPCLPGGWWLSA